MSKAISELNALCDALSLMRASVDSYSVNQMYRHFCKPGTGTIGFWYGRKANKTCYVHFIYTTWFGAVSKVSISTTKPY